MPETEKLQGDKIKADPKKPKENLKAAPAENAKFQRKLHKRRLNLPKLPKSRKKPLNLKKTSGIWRKSICL